MKVDCDDYTLASTFVATKKRRSSTLIPNKHGKQDSQRTLKSAKLKAPSKKALSVFQGKLGASHERRHKDDVAKQASELALQKDLDAACALVELANEHPSLPKNDLNGKPAIKVLIAKMDNDKLPRSNGDESWVSKKIVKNFGKLQRPTVEYRESLDVSLKGVCSEEKRKVDNCYYMPQLEWMKGHDSEKDNLYETYGFLDGHELTIRLGDKGRQHVDACLRGGHHRLGMLLSGSDWASKRARGKAKKRIRIQDPPSLKKRKLHKANVKAGIPSEPPLPERNITDYAVSENELLKKPQFTSMTPAIPYGFSFSIVHLLSAVRMAMIMPPAIDDLTIGEHLAKSNINGANEMHSHGSNQTGDQPEPTEKKSFPNLTIHEVVQRVKSNPRDPCILETNEPLQDLVRGVLKIFSSKTAPLGAKGWKALTFYDKSSKTWSWIGPVASNLLNTGILDDDISPEAWCIHHKTLRRLVDSFASWLKSRQEAIQQIGELPAPPELLMQPTVDTKERFRNLTKKMSVATISKTSEEVRAYFRKEEALRYLDPSRAFSYTAIDGRKSTVAPLGRCSGKPSSKGRNHFMLKDDRPPHVTILCLVRDAAARMPGGIGTRADIGTLIRDSQYIVEDITDRQINSVVSGGLDRLHYETDPCVQYDGRKNLWVYLHGDREEADFEDCSSSPVKHSKLKNEQTFKEQQT